MKKNPFYTAPEAEFLDVWFEDNILSYSDQGTELMPVDPEDDF